MPDSLQDILRLYSVYHLELTLGQVFFEIHFKWTKKSIVKCHFHFTMRLQSTSRLPN